MSEGGGGGHGKRRGHEEEHEEHENHERWLVSYADMMTLLMVLFIVMFAISQVDSKKFMALKNGLESGFGSPLSMLDGADDLLSVGGHIAPDSVNLAGRAGNKNADPNESSANDGLRSEVNPDVVADLVNQTNKAAVKQEVGKLKQAQKELQKALATAGMAKAAQYRFDERGLVVSIATDKVLFVSGSATLLPGGRTIIDAVAPTLKKLPNKLEIDGHTDANPIATAQFASNWELSLHRATGVLRYLAATQKIPYSRMHAAGFAETRPLKKGKDAASLAANRRVEIVVIAQVDNSLGNAVEELGNTTPVDRSASPPPASTATPHASPTPSQPSGAKATATEGVSAAEGKAKSTPSKTTPARASPTRSTNGSSGSNLLGLEPNTAKG